jgi:hypothetical protein
MLSWAHLTSRGPRSLWGGVASGRDCVLPGTEQVQGDIVLIPHYPAIVPGRDAEEIARPEDNFGPVCHLDRRMARYHQAEVLYLAKLGAGRWPNVLRPPPTRFVDSTPYLLTANNEELKTTVGERAHLLRDGHVHDFE